MACQFLEKKNVKYIRSIMDTLFQKIFVRLWNEKLWKPFIILVYSNEKSKKFNKIAELLNFVLHIG